jgi:NAD kinase
LRPQDRVIVKMSPYRVKMITVKGCSFFELLRQKLHWTGSSL